MNDCIRGEYLPEICDMRFGTEPKLPYRERLEIPDKKRISLYAKTDYINGALQIIRSHPDKLFTVVTHNSDHPINETLVPKNIDKWFAMNLNYDHPKIYPLPIGLENEYWHPHKQQILENAPTFDQRKVCAFAQFAPHTYPQERAPLISDLQSGKVDGDIYKCRNGTDYEIFVENLRKYAFCICPRGNGIDTHRMWEALYMGCIPIVKRYYAHKFDVPIHYTCVPLPILYIDDWKEITPELLQHTYNSIDRTDITDQTLCSFGFESKLLSMAYWKGIITDQ